MRCDGAKWNLVLQRLERCEDEGLWPQDAQHLCYFCLKVDLGLIESEHRTHDKVEPEERDPFQILLAEWAT